MDTWLNNKVNNRSSKHDTNNLHLSQTNYYLPSDLKVVPIPPSTNRYHCHYLFMRMLTFATHMTYDLPDKQKINLVNESLKQAFYKFCQEQTT